MSYLTIISRDEAKDYLGVDDDSRNDEIERMIKSALSYLEKRTNHIFFKRDKTYNYDDGCVPVYDYPINSTTSTTHTEEKKGTYSLFTETDGGITDITINVGYNTLDDVPSELVEAGLMLVEHFFNNKEQDKSKVPFTVQEIVDEHRRFIL